MNGPADDVLAPPAGAAWSDAVDVAFGDPAAGVHGMARIGLVPDGDGWDAARATAVAVLWDGRALAASALEGDVAVAAPDPAALAAGGVRLEVLEPGVRWRAVLEGAGGGFDLELEAGGPAAELVPEAPLARATGRGGRDVLCAVRGEARIGDRRIAVDGVGQRSRTWGPTPWETLAVTRSVGVWFAPGDGVVLGAARPRAAEGHEQDAVAAHLVRAGGPHPVADPRLSTTFDGEGRQRRGSLELWEHEDGGFPLRVTGEAIAGTTFDLGRLRLDLAVFRWRADGREGLGRYDVLRRA